MMPAMFTCGRTAGWCAHILEQKRLGKLVRPAAIYVGPAPRSPESVEGWDEIAKADVDGVGGHHLRLGGKKLRRAGAPNPRRRAGTAPGSATGICASLVGHASRSLITVSTYLQTAAEREDVATPQDYYAQIRDYASNAGAEAIIERGRQAGRDLGEDPVGDGRRAAWSGCSAELADCGRPADRGHRRAGHPAAHLSADPDVRARGARPRYRAGHRAFVRTCPPTCSRRRRCWRRGSRSLTGRGDDRVDGVDGANHAAAVVLRRLTPAVV